MKNQEIQMMEDNLQQVWNEKNSTTRLEAIKKIYGEEAKLYHVGHKVKGLDAINDSVTTTLQKLPPDFIFTQLKPVTINNNLGRLIWGAGPESQPHVATGMDIAHFKDGKIKSLYVFLD
ncbi:nuclear transport factor 2 family protein [Chryseobacterium chendengshani]|uniref:nuclear transport factor 2 family protein n=1 Tax=Chryseobacterium sp. LJ668 TaxID=2864040 RepID=UPI001C691C53|nr:nuclear transport factor 2 family protein [Chryseobacterium sp. LJ668]MBW8522929.1 nuclear transport factor 2 family protein [Chryseobacterium sp. LJ668]QYK16458.1 nuclear transport factor 2 family protein [Chryseobacterium sp. LJ668]